MLQVIFASPDAFAGFMCVVIVWLSLVTIPARIAAKKGYDYWLFYAIAMVPYFYIPAIVAAVGMKPRPGFEKKKKDEDRPEEEAKE